MASLRSHLEPRHKLWLNWNGAFLMGPRYLRFLEAVDHLGTIRAAGRAVGWSYRPCLNHILAMEGFLVPNVRTPSLGVSLLVFPRLTREARRLVKVFAQWRKEALHSSDRAFQKVLRR